MNMNYRQVLRKRQSGVALVIAMLFLLVMTLLSTSSMRSSMMQERMAGHARDLNLGFQGAEAGLRAAEKFLSETPTLPVFDDTNGLYVVNSVDRPVWIGDTPSDGAGGYVTYPVTIPYVAVQPKYYVEKLSSVRPAGTETETGTPTAEIFFYRVTAVGYGGAVDTVSAPLSAVVLSSVYRSR